jgi:hypothetical protein
MAEVFECPGCDKRYTKEHYFIKHKEKFPDHFQEHEKHEKNKKKEILDNQFEAEYIEKHTKVQELEIDTGKPKRKIDIPDAMDPKTLRFWKSFWATLEGMTIQFKYIMDTLEDNSKILKKICENTAIDKNTKKTLMHQIDSSTQLLDKAMALHSVANLGSQGLPVPQPSRAKTREEADIELLEAAEKVQVEKPVQKKKEEVLDGPIVTETIPFKNTAPAFASKPTFSSSTEPVSFIEQPEVKSAPKAKPKSQGNLPNDQAKARASIKGITEKALLLTFTCGAECWVPKSTVHNNFNNVKNIEQDFIIDKWILKRNEVKY